MSFGWEIHLWRGFLVERDLFYWRLTAGFTTILLCKFCISDRLKIIAETLAEAKAKLEGR